MVSPSNFQDKSPICSPNHSFNVEDSSQELLQETEKQRIEDKNIEDQEIAENEKESSRITRYKNPRNLC